MKTGETAPVLFIFCVSHALCLIIPRKNGIIEEMKKRGKTEGVAVMNNDSNKQGESRNMKQKE